MRMSPVSKSLVILVPSEDQTACVDPFLQFFALFSAQFLSHNKARRPPQSRSQLQFLHKQPLLSRLRHTLCLTERL